jgi:opacity protein-like surface antigen
MTTICSQTSVKAANKVYKNVKLIFEDNQGNTIKTFTKDIAQGETLGQILGDQYPTMKADSKLGNFTGWYSSDCLYGLYSGKRYEKNTPVNIEYDYEEDDYIQISFKAAYEKKSVRITYYYIDNTGWHEKDEESILTPGTGKNAIFQFSK